MLLITQAQGFSSRSDGTSWDAASSRVRRRSQALLVLQDASAIIALIAAGDLYLDEGVFHFGRKACAVRCREGCRILLLKLCLGAGGGDNVLGAGRKVILNVDDHEILRSVARENKRALADIAALVL